jgi:putative phosphoesterase
MSVQHPALAFRVRLATEEARKRWRHERVGRSVAVLLRRGHDGRPRLGRGFALGRPDTRKHPIVGGSPKRVVQRFERLSEMPCNRVHGNLPALDATLSDIHAQHPGRVYCLGDPVGYAPFPNEVVERIRQEHIPTVMGNYDDGVGFDRNECGCAYKAPLDQELGQRSLEWSRAHTTADNKTCLRGLVPEIRFDVDGKRVLLVHGSPRKMNEYLFEDRPLSSFERLAHSSNADVIVFGHTHVPYTKHVEGVLFVNVGSVGKPKDGDPRACYALVDLTAGAPVTFRRVPYDIATVARAIRDSDLPDKFARDVELGGAVAAPAQP